MAQTLSPHNELEVAHAFDAVSKIFETTFENELTRSLRSKIYHEVEQLLPQGASILDINCGTGIDAIHFAAKGYRVTGVDVSPKMLEEAKKKIAGNHALVCAFHQGSFKQLPPAIGEKFDLVFSNFGGLNCTDNLITVTKEIARIVKPSGFFVGVIMPPFSLWETISYLVRGKFASAFRRLSSKTNATGFFDTTFKVSYHSPSKVSHLLSPYFNIRQITGLSIISPPPHAVRFSKTFPTLSNFLVRFDNMIERFPFLRAAGDHYIVIAQKR